MEIDGSGWLPLPACLLSPRIRNGFNQYPCGICSALWRREHLDLEMVFPPPSQLAAGAPPRGPGLWGLPRRGIGPRCPRDSVLSRNEDATLPYNIYWKNSMNIMITIQSRYYLRTYLHVREDITPPKGQRGQGSLDTHRSGEEVLQVPWAICPQVHFPRLPYGDRKSFSHSFINSLTHLFVHSFIQCPSTMCHALYQMLGPCDNWAMHERVNVIVFSISLEGILINNNNANNNEYSPMLLGLLVTLHGGRELA